MNHLSSLRTFSAAFLVSTATQVQAVPLTQSTPSVQADTSPTAASDEKRSYPEDDTPPFDVSDREDADSAQKQTTAFTDSDEDNDDSDEDYDDSDEDGTATFGVSDDNDSVQQDEKLIKLEKEEKRGTIKLAKGEKKRLKEEKRGTEANPINYERSCPDSDLKFKCGEEYCDQFTITPYNFFPLSSLEPMDSRYNQAAYLGLNRNLRGVCVDSNILNDPTAAYRSGELNGLIFHGVLKLVDRRTRELYYIPFKTRELRKIPDSNLDRVQYSDAAYAVRISPSDEFKVFFNHNLGFQAIKWEDSKEELIDTALSYLGIDYRGKPRLPRSYLTLRLDEKDRKGNSYGGGGSYVAILEGKLNLPWENSIELSVNSRINIKFAKPGKTNFRLDSRYPRTVSLLPRPGFYEQEEGDFNLVEIILIPPEK